MAFRHNKQSWEILMGKGPGGLWIGCWAASVVAI